MVRVASGRLQQRHTQTGNSVVRVSVNFSQSLLCSGTSPAASLEAALQRCALCAVISVSASEHANSTPCSMLSTLGGRQTSQDELGELAECSCIDCRSSVSAEECCLLLQVSEFLVGVWRGGPQKH